MTGITTPAVIDCDVLVIGGGPAGSTAATLLAQKGHRVTLLEKSRYPRFHLGESLLPANLPLFETLGVADEVRAIGMEKRTVELALKIFKAIYYLHALSRPRRTIDAWMRRRRNIRAIEASGREAGEA